MTRAPSDLQALLREHRALLDQYGDVQQRCQRLLSAQRDRIARLEAETIRLRAAVIVRDTALAFARQERAAPAAPLPGLPQRMALVRCAEALMRRVRVLCIGQGTTNSGATQWAMEHAGGQFLHHDVADANDGAALEASLRAADLVICQTGCIGHDAYWRVQDHCRRTGKPCVLVAQPQALRFVSRIEREALTEGKSQ